MRKLIVSTFLTLDGVMQAPGGPSEDESGGFRHGGWSVTYWDARMGEIMDEALAAPFDLLLGRRTYDIFASHWPDERDDTARLFNEATKYVASRSRPTLAWRGSVLLEGNVADAVAALKADDDERDLQVHGSGNLVQTLLRHSLIDEVRLWMFPLVLGSGKRLFGDGTRPAGLRLIDSEVSSTGVLIGRYVPVGEVVTGSFASA